MWNQVYTPVHGSLGLSAACAALPILILLIALGIFRVSAWKAAISGLLTSIVVAIAIYGMPVPLALRATVYGAAFGLFPIAWIVFWALALYRLTVDTGQFEIIKNSVGHLTQDRRLQALLIAFAFGAFVEGASGFGTPVAVAAAMLSGLGFAPFEAAAICLIANTSPVAFGAIGTPLITLATVTNLPLAQLSADVGKICAPVSLFIPAYLMLVMGGVKALKAVLPAALVCGICFATTQFLVSTYIGPYLTDILASLVAILGLLVLLSLWRPSDVTRGYGPPAAEVPSGPSCCAPGRPTSCWSSSCCCGATPRSRPCSTKPRSRFRGRVSTAPFNGCRPWLRRPPPILRNSLSTSCQHPELRPCSPRSARGWCCACPCASGLPRLARTARDLKFSILTMACVLALAYVMNYSGATASLGLALAATGPLFPFFGALLGWLGVFLTGSDTSANALFGNLQVVTANNLGLDPALMAAGNSSGGVMGKMISLQSISVAAAATGMPASDEARLFGFTLKHSVFLACIIGLVVCAYAYA